MQGTKLSSLALCAQGTTTAPLAGMNGEGKGKGEKERKKRKGKGKRKRKKSKGNGEKGKRKGNVSVEEGKREEKGKRGSGDGKRVNSTATSSAPRAPQGPSPCRPAVPTPVAAHDAPAARLQHRVGARPALEVQPDGQHTAGAVVVEHDLGELPRVDRAQHRAGLSAPRQPRAWRRHRGPDPAARRRPDRHRPRRMRCRAGAEPAVGRGRCEGRGPP